MHKSMRPKYEPSYIRDWPKMAEWAGRHLDFTRKFKGEGTVHPTPYTLHPAHYTSHPSPYTLHPTPSTLHPTPYTPNTTLYTPQPTPSTPNRTPSIRIQDVGFRA